MIATIELPNNTHERDFVLEVLKRLNIRFTLDNMSEDVEESVLEEHAAILRDRRKAMQSPDAQFYTWEQAQTVLANRKANKEEDEATFWSRYTPKQRIELEQAFEESHASKEWISHEDMKKKHEKYLIA
jgi:hypothetical protein